MSRYIAEEVALHGVEDEGEGFLWAARAKDHKHIAHLDGFFMLLPEAGGLQVGFLEGIVR